MSCKARRWAWSSTQGTTRSLGELVANLASNVEHVPTPLSRELDHVILVSTSIAFLIGGIFFVLSLIYGFHWLDSMIFLIGLIVAYVPEGLRMTVTICLTLTARRMTKKNCLVKNLDAVETLGSTSIVCTDKTGPLTQNRMTVAHLWLDNCIAVVDTTENRSARLWNNAEFLPDQEDKPILERLVKGDASESAIYKFTELMTPGVMQYHSEYKKVTEIPFNSANKYQVSIHQRDDGPGYFLVMIGAPERILKICSTILINGEDIPLDTTMTIHYNTAYEKLGEMGERLLGLCRYDLPIDQFPDGYHSTPKTSTSR